MPFPLVRLKFQILSVENDFITDINFVWDNCADNSIAVVHPIWECGYPPKFLAVSKDVLDPENNLITGIDPLYGGVSEGCLGGGLDRTPQRFIDFTNGRITYHSSCCKGQVGNANWSSSEIPSVSDITEIIDNLFGTGSPVGCLDEADVDLSGAPNPLPGDITVSDITGLIDHLFGSGAALPNCP